MCCVVLFRSSNQSHLRSPGEELYTGQFVTTIRVPINDLTETCSCMGGAYYKGSLIHLHGVNSLDTKAQRLGVRLHFPPGVACMGSLVGEWLFVLITLTLFHLYNVKPLVTLNRFSVGIMYLTSNVMNIMCFYFLACWIVHCTSQWGKQLDSSTSLSWLPLQDLRPTGLPLLQGSVRYQTRRLPGKTKTWAFFDKCHPDVGVGRKC